MSGPIDENMSVSALMVALKRASDQVESGSQALVAVQEINTALAEILPLLTKLAEAKPPTFSPVVHPSEVKVPVTFSGSKAGDKWRVEYDDGRSFTVTRL